MNTRETIEEAKDHLQRCLNALNKPVSFIDICEGWATCETINGTERVEPGDWIVRDALGFSIAVIPAQKIAALVLLRKSRE